MRSSRSPRPREAAYAREPDSTSPAERVQRAGRAAVRRRQRPGLRRRGHQQLPAASRPCLSVERRRRSCAADGRIYAVPALFDYPAFSSPASRRPTNIVPSPDAGLTIQATLANPFPTAWRSRRAPQTAPNTFVGRTLDRFTDRPGLPQRPGDALGAERAARAARAVGGRSGLRRQPGIRPHDRDVQLQSRCRCSTSRRATVRDRPTINFLTANVTNPFAGWSRGTTQQPRRSSGSSCCGRTRSSRTSRHALYDGSSATTPAQFRLEKRFSKGYTVLTTYTYSHFKEKLRRGSTRPIPDSRSATRERLAPPARRSTGSGSCRSGATGAGAPTRIRLVNAHHRQLERVVHLELADGPSEPARSATSTTTATSTS